MVWNPQHQLFNLSELVKQRPVCIAYSGGVDSHVLLHLLATNKHLFPSLRAIHVNHGLHAESVHWASHCQNVANRLAVDLSIVSVNVEQRRQLGLEAAAREARYRAIQNKLHGDEVLLTAQHQQDQAETLLLQLFRGAGPAGLSAMQTRTELYGMTIIRPLLDVPKQALLDYALQNQLQWIDDPSNSDTQINRNYLRHEVWPLLEARWSGAAKTLSRSAQHCEDAVSILEEMAKMDASRCVVETGQITIDCLLALPSARQRNLLRYIIEQNQLALPSTAILQRIIDEVCLAEHDAQPLVEWPGALVRRYLGYLYLEADLAFEVDSPSLNILNTDDVLLNEHQVLKWQPTVGNGLKLSVFEAGLELRYRQGGERLRLHGHSHHSTLKNLFQQWQIPPWQRSSIPLLFHQDELVAVVGYGYAQGYSAEEGEKGLLACIEG